MSRGSGRFTPVFCTRDARNGVMPPDFGGALVDFGMWKPSLDSQNRQVTDPREHSQRALSIFRALL